jgi:hypothetical protein
VKAIERSALTDYEMLWLELDYKELFSLFIAKRKIGLLRFLFSLPTSQFAFSIDLFQRALELDAIDMAALIYREFFRLIREVTPYEEELILTSLVSSFAKSNGMLEFKCFLVRQFSERLQLRHARRLLDTLDLKIKAKNKQNLFVLNLNIVKSACLVVEMLEVVGQKFNSLVVRCQTIRQRAVAIVREYLN